MSHSIGAMRAVVRIACVIAALSTNAVHADDAGWRVRGPAGVQVHDLVATAAQPGRLYAVGRDGVFRSDDGGDSWSTVDDGLGGLDVNVVAASPRDPDFVVVAQVDGALQVSHDGGASWAAGSGSAVGTVSAIAIDPQDDRIVLALDGQDLLRSADRGLTWRRTAFGTVLNAVAFAPGQPAVYLGTGAGLFESVDGGVTWTDVAGEDVFGGWWFGDRRIVALTEDADGFSVIGLAAADAGTHAFRMPGGAGGRLVSREPVRAAERIAFAPAGAGARLARALLAGPHGIYGSVDAGAIDDLETAFYGGANHWLLLTAGLPPAGADGHRITALLFDPATAHRYFAVVDGAVIRYDGTIGADLRIGGRQVDGFDEPASMSPVCCEDTADGGKRLLLQFTLRNHSAATATDVEFRIAVDPPASLSATATPFACNARSAAETVCTIAEFGPGSVDGLATVVLDAPADYRVTATVTAAERDPTPASNTAVHRFPAGAFRSDSGPPA